ncbi:MULTISPECIES: HlyD family type I secretion periplasmic adaptor subunit [unclassified Dyella]|uniref:HlyD family type I secretion periplasmic adaptor subunit n=1 Tax=unclassified Dyella TaxID=2634549 RepID=UPI00203244FA|nr:MULTISPECIES: HlyD family type I secretion periplasmic adaptor subunit [unclassified Dyella]
MNNMLARYREVWKEAWARRNEQPPADRTAEEAAFLPAHLELIDTPLAAAPRWTLRLIMALFACTAIWACVGKVDIVAVAPGRTVPGGRTKTIQPIETAVVHRILVADGDHVAKGQLLVELDATAADAESNKAREALLDARATVWRTTALIAAIESGAPLAASAAELPPERQEAARQLANGQYAAYNAKVHGLDAMLAQREAELRTVESAIVPLEQYLDISRTKVADYESLLSKNYVPRQEYLLRKQERITAERDLAQQQSRRQELRSAIVGAREELALHRSDTRQQLLDERRKASEQIGQLEPEVARTAQRRALMQLRSPVDGTVQSLDIHTVGGVVTPAQKLLSVVPDDDPVEVEATVLNADIGFVREGQSVAVKIDSFPYTRYGYLEGTVASVSHDAIQDEKLGLVYKARVKLAKSSLMADGVRVTLGAGMTLAAEIRTGKRTIAEYLSGPLTRAGSEAMRER